MRLPALTVGLLSGVLLLSACTDEPAPPEAFPLPAMSSFRDGTCALVAGDVLALGRSARELGSGPGVADAVSDEFMTAQKGLQAVAETVEPELKPLLDAVVTRAGLVRLATDSERYDPTVSEPLQESYAALLAACTGAAASGLPATPTATTS